jgi:glyoxylase-like metal-dependent hydrolase (beta-lactamase superfamily II)
MIKISDSLYVVKPGKAIYDKEAIQYASSTVTLIDDGFLILVDTGLEEDWPLIKAGIEEAGFHTSEINVIVNTHLHVDHVGCNNKFKAKKYAHPKEIQRVNAQGYTPSPRKISEKTLVLETPGHVDGHISIVFKEGRIVMAGDAIPTRDHYARRIIPRVHSDAEMAMKSLLKILKIADVIVPGHDEPIKVTR